jgi:gliding motility-associated-like protein
MKNKAIFTVFFTLFSLATTLKAQEFFICDDVGNIGKVNLLDCSYTSIPIKKIVPFFTDITFHPNGKLYGCVNRNIYEIDTQPNSSPRFVASSDFAYATSLTADKNGIIYGADGILWSYNIATNQFRSHGFMKVGSEYITAGGDLTFYNGNLYVASDKNKMVQLNIDQPTASSFVFSFASRDTIFGIMSYKDCDKVRTFATNNRKNSDIYEIDWLTKTTNIVCTIPVKVYGAASRYEFLASKPDTTLLELTTCDPNKAKTTTQTLKTSFNCDSIVTTKITYAKPDPTSFQKTLCEGDSFLFGNKFYQQTGIYNHIFQSKYGCDSLVSLTLNVLKKDTFSQNKTTCNPLKVGIQKDILKNTQGCDSIIFTNFSFKNDIRFNQKQNICSGQSLNVGDTLLKTTGVYVKILKNKEGCDSTVTTDLTVTALDLVMPRDTIVGLGDKIRITGIAQAITPLQWKWTPKDLVSCDTCFSTLARPLSTTAFRLVVFDSLSKCRKEGLVTIQIKTDCAAFVPNVFSPNGDGANDKLNIYLDTKCIKKVNRFSIFNRWGDLIIESQATSSDFPREWELWDGLIAGKVAPNEVYVYVIEIEYINGQTHIVSGDAALIK